MKMNQLDYRNELDSCWRDCQWTDGGSTSSENHKNFSERTDFGNSPVTKYRFKMFIEACNSANITLPGFRTVSGTTLLNVAKNVKNYLQYLLSTVDQHSPVFVFPKHMYSTIRIWPNSTVPD